MWKMEEQEGKEFMSSVASFKTSHWSEITDLQACYYMGVFGVEREQDLINTKRSKMVPHLFY